MGFSFLSKYHVALTLHFLNKQIVRSQTPSVSTTWSIILAVYLHLLILYTSTCVAGSVHLDAQVHFTSLVLCAMTHISV